LTRTGPPGYIGWRNRFLGSLNVYKFGLRRKTAKQLITSRYLERGGLHYRKKVAMLVASLVETTEFESVRVHLSKLKMDSTSKEVATKLLPAKPRRRKKI
jgi:hypothetical protein